LPATETGAVGTAQLLSDRSDLATAGIVDDGKVCVTNDRASAVLFAAVHRTPWVYEVEPIGALEPDPDCLVDADDPFRSMRCERALIVRRFKPSNAEVWAVRQAIRELTRRGGNP